jgi:hypothetical protein
MATNNGDLQRIVGDAARLNRDVTQFRRSAEALSLDHEALVRQYAGKWVAAYDGKIRAAEATLDRLLARVTQMGLPRESAVVEFVERQPVTLIL